MTKANRHFSADTLKVFCSEALERLGVSHENAQITANVLVEADLRGIESHGVARLRRYVSGIQQGIMQPKANPKLIEETLNTATIDGDGGLGQPTSYRAMERAIIKARKHSLGFVAVRNSNHFGIAGYYAMMALAHDMIGVCTTNSEVLVVPTFARNAILGTNPIAIAIPAAKERPFMLDMSTSTVTRGKLEVYARMEKSIPINWATDEKGVATNDPARVLQNIIRRVGGGLLPLGGASEETGGHKGYGLALAMEIFSAVLPGALYADRVYPKNENGKPLPSGIGHFFGAMRIDAFRPKEGFKRDMDDLIRRLKTAQKAKGADRIYIHGEKEFENAERLAKQGIPLSPKIVEDLRTIADQLGMRKPF
ncbi:MAG: Ldh family oxidoreductase [Candidatus Bathyarchaeota archaeon]|nr:Ldh family oxidoreductase [Candidatus Bathyarchaeota archaeon]MDH5787215.1 Ldh family oxidoreductase [Candidatus Bathyarchaeota archaeon]